MLVKKGPSSLEYLMQLRNPGAWGMLIFFQTGVKLVKYALKHSYDQNQAT